MTSESSEFWVFFARCIWWEKQWHMYIDEERRWVGVGQHWYVAWLDILSVLFFLVF
jgi:hypothetical protein